MVEVVADATTEDRWLAVGLPRHCRTGPGTTVGIFGGAKPPVGQLLTDNNKPLCLEYL